MTFSFAPATREQARARIGIQGPAGSGKTKTALRIADGLAAGGPIGLIDTERESALTYAPVPGRPDLGGHTFGHMPMSTCSPENLLAAVDAARAAGLAVLVIDSWSHFWAGKGGLLERVDQEAKKPGHFGGSYTAWAPVNTLEQDMLDALMGFPGHVIVTMRTKNDYEMEGKKVTKVGVKTIQREGAEYELGLVIDMVKGTGTVTKTRYQPLEDMTVHHPGEDLAAVILEQLGAGVDPAQVIMDDLVAPGLTYERALELHAQAKRRGVLSAGQLHPRTGTPSTLEALLAEYGRALRPGPTAVPPITAGSGTAAAPATAPATASRAPEPTADSQEWRAEDQGDIRSNAAGPAEPQQHRPASAPQLRKLTTDFGDLGIRERADRLRATSLIIGRPVPTANDLTLAEAGRLIDALESHGDAAAVAAWLDQLEDKAVRSAESGSAARAA